MLTIHLTTPFLIFQWIYNSIAYLFKYLSPQLIQDPLPTFKVLQPQLADKRHYIRSFSAEAYAFLLRKVKLSDLMRIFSDIVDDLRRVGSTDYCDGICVLFFEVCKVFIVSWLCVVCTMFFLNFEYIYMYILASERNSSFQG